MHTTHRVGFEPKPILIPLRFPSQASIRKELQRDMLEDLLESPVLAKRYDSDELLSELIQVCRDPLRRQIALLYYRENLSSRAVAIALQLDEHAVTNHLRRFRISACETLLQLLKSHDAAEAL